MVKHPWDDHPHDHPIVSTVLACAAIAVGIAGVLSLKHERKASPVLDAGACYVWSDGHKTCRAVMPYVCNANDRERGECE